MDKNITQQNVGYHVQPKHRIPSNINSSSIAFALSCEAVPLRPSVAQLNQIYLKHSFSSCAAAKRSFAHRCSGFTLIELMVSLVLGLIIVAAGVQLLITGQKSLSMQKGVADIQSNGIFGLDYMLRDIQLANTDGTDTVITDTTSLGGVVLSSTNLPTTITSDSVSKSALNDSNVNVGGAAQKSDQLVVQFYAVQDGYDCEGNSYTSGRYIIQRYFLRKDNNGSTSEPNTALALACESGSYAGSSATAITPSSGTGTFGSRNGQIILHRVDHFHLLLGVSDASHSGSFRYMTIEQYMALSATARQDTRINSLQLALLVRSTESIGTESQVNNTATYQMLDQSVTVNTPSNSTAKYLRQVVQQTVALRNGICIADSSLSSATCA